MLFKSRWHFKNSKLDECVLLWTYAFTLRSIMVSTRLLIKFRKYCISFSEFDFFLILKVMELPSYKWIIKRIYICGYEWTTPICVKSKIFQVLLGLGWKELEPVDWILEFWDFILWNTDTLQYLILSRWYTNALVLIFLLLRVFCFILRAWARFYFTFMLTLAISLCFTCSYLSLKSVSGCLNRHASTMETKWEDHIFSYLSLISCLKLTLRQRKGMTYIM